MGGRILVVEDDERIRSSMRLALEGEGYDVKDVASGEEALDLPYLWTDRAVWAVIGDPTVQNFNNPTTPQGQAAFGMIGGSIWPTQIWIS